MSSSVAQDPSPGQPRPVRFLRGSYLLPIAGLLIGCSSSESIATRPDSSTAGGISATGGVTPAGGRAGGTTATGETVSITGGSTAAGATGGAGTTSGGGTAISGGSTASGGTSRSGGTSATGGIPSSGGSVTVDAGPGGGSSGTGGASSSGGTTRTDGTSATGGSPAVDAGTGGRDASASGGRAGADASTGGAATGGTAATGGATGAGGSAGAGGATSPAGCTAVPVTPNPTQQARNVLCYLYSQYGNHILSGQEESGAEVEINYIYTNTGKYPAIRAFEANSDPAATRCLTYWNAGGLCMFGYHMGAPGQPDGYTGSQTKVSIDTVLTVGSNENTVFNQRIDAIAKRMLTVQAGNGVVIFRPFHEAGGAWFWWSMETGAQYVRLWKYAFDRVINTNGVRNALWLLPYDGSPQASFYPGKEYVDIGGADNYNKANDYSPMTSIFTAARNIFGTTMPIALHECGPVVDPDQLQSTKTNWVFFSIWTQPYPETYSTVAELQKVYSSSYVVSRDGVPNLK
jgi:hypothetical protein